jgi:hypothetical protein
MTRRRIGLGLIVAALTVASGATNAQTGELTLTAGIGDNEHVAIASRGRYVALAWAVTRPSGNADIVASLSRDEGATFSAPARVNNVPGQARVNGERPPRVVLVPGAAETPVLVVVWGANAADVDRTAPTGGRSAAATPASGTRLLMARSNDGGRTFSPATSVPGTDAPGNRGWHSVAVDAAGRPMVLWLDHRDTAGAPGQHDQHAAASPAARPPTSTTADGVARAQLSQLFVGSADAKLPPRAIARGVCYCCKTALAAGEDGSIYAAWRHVYDGNRRDIAFVASKDGGRTFAAPVRVSEDGWQIDGCPENGPALAVDRQRVVHVVWPTMVRDRGRETMTLFHSTSRDGRTFSPRAALPVAGPAYHPQIALTDRSTPVVAWEEVAAGGRRIKLWRGGTAEDLGAGVYPAVAVTPSRTVIAWTRRAGSASAIIVRR